MKKSFLIFTTLGFLSLVCFAAEENAIVEKPAAVTAFQGSAEEQIPLTIDNTKKTAESTSSSSRILLTGIIISSLLAAAYYYVRKYKTSNKLNKSSTQIKVISQHYLGPKKSLAIIHVAGESMLVGITDANISMIKSLSLIDDEIPNTMPKNFTEAMISSQLTNELEEEFSFSGLKDSVSRKLKSMRSI